MWIVRCEWNHVDVEPRDIGSPGVRTWTGAARDRALCRACDTAGMGQMRDLADRLDAAAAAMTGLGPSIAAGEPWPLTATYGPGPESEWGPREVLAHVAEMLPYWLGEIERIVDAGGTDTPGFGRLEDDTIRVAIIGRDRTFPGRELLGRIDVEARRVAARFRALDGAESGFQGRHVTRGDLSVADIAERLVVGHVEGHVGQLRDLVTAQ